MSRRTAAAAWLPAAGPARGEPRRAGGDEPASAGGLVVGSLCTGYGGLDLGVLAAVGGGRLAWVADPDPAVRAVLAARFPAVPNLGDITTADWATAEPVDVLTAGFPCQDISTAGRRAGITEGTRSGLWYSVLHAVRCLRPALLVVENVAALRSRNGGLGTVLGGLAGIGYDTSWRSVRAADVGAPHRRERVFLLAYPVGTRLVRVADPAGRRPARAAHPDAPGTEPDRRQPARPNGPAAAHPAGHRRARRPATAAAAGPPPAGQPPGRGDRAPTHPHPAGTTAGPAGRSGGAAAADPGGGQPERRRGPGRMAGQAGAARGEGDQRQRDGDAAVRGGPAADYSPGHQHRNPRRPAAARPAGAAAVPDTAGGRGGEGQPEPAQLGRAAWADRDSGTAAADPTGGQQPQQPHRADHPAVRAGAGAGRRDHPRHHPGGADHTRAGAAELAGADPAGHDAGLSGPAHPGPVVDWGQYTPAIRRWETVLGRPAPHPTEPGRAGRPRLAAVFVEWLMGLPAGWVTAVPGVSRAAQIRALGNGVVPAQAAAAVTLLLADLLTEQTPADHEQATAA